MIPNYWFIQLETEKLDLFLCESHGVVIGGTVGVWNNKVFKDFMF